MSATSAEAQISPSTAFDARQVDLVACGFDHESEVVNVCLLSGLCSGIGREAEKGNTEDGDKTDPGESTHGNMRGLSEKDFVACEKP